MNPVSHAVDRRPQLSIAVWVLRATHLNAVVC
jgi:hypothetical protein